jgi:glycosyltransferase involved in cell wall biosynthesis
MIYVVIPTLNEEESIAKVVKGCRSALKGRKHKIWVVDGRSSDKTVKEAKKAGVDKIMYQFGKGYGDAYLSGFKSLPNDCKIVVMLDADQTYDPNFIPKLVEPVEKDEADIVLGNRWADMKKGAMSRKNQMGNRFLTWLLNRMYHFNITDSQSGMRAISKPALDAMDLYAPGMPLASEMLIETRKKNLRLLEIPITYEPRIGEAKQSVRQGISIAALTMRLLRDYNPLLLFGMISLGLFGIGLLLGLKPILNYVQTGTLNFPGTAILSSMFITTSILFFGFALMIDLLINTLKRDGK